MKQAFFSNKIRSMRTAWTEYLHQLNEKKKKKVHDICHTITFFIQMIENQRILGGRRR